MSDNRDLLIAGLKDAYALETQGLDMMRTQASRLEGYPELKARIQQHLTETEQQLKRLEGCLAQFNEPPSTLRDVALKLTGSLQSLFHAAAEDEVIKNVLASNAFENYEIATYKGLAAMAEYAGANDVADVARQSLREEEDMARFVSEHIESTVRDFMAQRAARATGQAGAA